LHDNTEDQDADEDGVVAYAGHHVDLIEDATAINFVEELHPDKGVVYDCVSVVARQILALPIRRQLDAATLRSLYLSAISNEEDAEPQQAKLNSELKCGLYRYIAPHVPID
jgi:hypothetical protein